MANEARTRSTCNRLGSIISTCDGLTNTTSTRRGLSNSTSTYSRLNNLTSTVDQLLNITSTCERLGNITSSCKRLADISSRCDLLGNALRDHAPASCSIATNGKWGNILARSVSNLTTIPAVPRHQGGCPTMGAGFNFSLVAASRIAAPGGFFNHSVLQSIFYGVTPIMTLSYTDEDGDARTWHV